MHQGYFLLKYADDEQTKFANKLRNIDKGIKPVEKKLFISNIGLFFTAREKVHNNFKNRLFQIKYIALEPEWEQSGSYSADGLWKVQPKY